jgi:hypothetical protein
MLLIPAGTGCIIYGSLYHMIPVTENREEKITLPAPMPIQPETRPGEGPPFTQPQTIQAIKTIAVTNDQPEASIIREVTFGGVTLAQAGKIIRTYSGSKGPAFCPT